MENKRFKYKSRMGKFLFFFGLGILMLFLATTIVYLLWNAILPQVTKVSTITFWQAMGILVLSKILFGGMRFGTGNRSKKYSHLKSKWHNITDEEKLELKEKWRARCKSGSDE